MATLSNTSAETPEEGKNTPEDFIRKYARFEFNEWKKDHPGQLAILCRALKDYGASLERENAELNESIKMHKELLSEAAETIKRYKAALEPSEDEVNAAIEAGQHLDGNDEYERGFLNAIHWLKHRSSLEGTNE